MGRRPNSSTYYRWRDNERIVVYYRIVSGSIWAIYADNMRDKWERLMWNGEPLTLDQLRKNVKLAG